MLNIRLFACLTRATTWSTLPIYFFMPVSWILFGYMLRRCSVKSTLQSLHINAKMCICWDYPMRVKMNLLLRFQEQIFRLILGFETNLATNIKKVKICKGGCFWKKKKKWKWVTLSPLIAALGNYGTAVQIQHLHRKTFSKERDNIQRISSKIILDKNVFTKINHAE